MAGFAENNCGLSPIIALQKFDPDPFDSKRPHEKSPFFIDVMPV
jgi:hypothetical protein